MCVCARVSECKKRRLEKLQACKQPEIYSTVISKLMNKPKYTSRRTFSEHAAHHCLDNRHHHKSTNHHYQKMMQTDVGIIVIAPQINAIVSNAERAQILTSEKRKLTI